MSNTRPYAFFGVRPLTVTHAAGLERKLALTMFRRLDARVLLPAALSAMGGDAAWSAARTSSSSPTSTASRFVANGAPFPWQVDGDYLGEVEQLEIRYEPDCLTLVAPVR